MPASVRSSSASSLSSSDDEKELTIADTNVVTKYKMAGAMNDKVMRAVINLCCAGANVLDLCKFGDEQIVKEAGTVFKKEKEMTKGVAFPTCISVNNCVCHYSPLESESNVVELVDGDVVKIDLATHIDGFVACAAHTLVVGANKENPVTGRKADVIKAAYYMSEAQIRVVKPDNKSDYVTTVCNKVADDFKCNSVSGMLSHQLKRNDISAEKSIISNPSERQKAEHKESKFEEHEVYALDSFASTGEGSAREMDARTTVFKRNPEIIYQLKMKASRATYSEITKKHNSMCFNLRTLEDEKRSKMGIVECVKHEVCTPFPVMFEKEGEFVAQFKYTTLLMPNGPLRITQSFYDPLVISSETEVTNPEIKALLATSIRNKNKNQKKKNKKKAKKAAAAVAEPAAVVEAAA